MKADVFAVRNSRSFAAEILLDAIENIQKHTHYWQLNVHWKKDLTWIHREHSTCGYWCDLADIDHDALKERFPLSLLEGSKSNDN